MTSHPSRRTFLKGMLAGAVVLGFDPATRSWVTTAQRQRMDRLPPLDGVVLTDESSLGAAADDFGHIIHRRPWAVLQPGSIDDIVAMVRFARRHRIQVAARGQGHSTYGQPQVAGGLVIDMRSLATTHALSPDRATVDAGVTWHTLLQQALALGSTPPVMTDYIDLSVGGTLSVGGIGGTSYRYGLQVDNVLELEVVTGEGQHLRCSATQRRDLFEATLAGLGQCALIVRATLRLVPAATHARVYNLFYDDLASFTADQQRLISEGRFSYVEGQIVAREGGGWRFLLEAASFYTPPAMPDDGALLRDLGDDRGSAQISDHSYYDFINRLAPTVAFLKQLGVWEFPHPWINLFIPGSQVNTTIERLTARLTLDDTGNGPILLYPIFTRRLTRPLFRVPDEPLAWLLSILRTAPPDPAIVAAMVADNRRLYDEVRAVGGTQYAISALPLSQADWRAHFRPAWGRLVSAKRRYDPDNLLTPGQGIFPA